MPHTRLSFVLPLLLFVFGGACTTAVENASRPVALEMFESNWCPHCQTVMPAVDRLRERYTPEQLTITAYHLSDSMSVPYGRTRATTYGVGGVPTAIFQSLTAVVGSQGSTDAAYAAYVAAIEAVRTASAERHFDLRAEVRVGPINPSMRVTVRTDVGYPNAVNAIGLVQEDGIPEGGKTYNFVVRGHLGTRQLLLATPGDQTFDLAYNGTIPCASRDRLYPVILLQDETTGEMVGAASGFSEAIRARRPAALRLW